MLDALTLPTPYLYGDPRLLTDRLAAFRRALPGVGVHYAVKCNPAAELLRAVAADGAGFEVASLGELELLQGIGVDPAEVLYSNTVKPAAHVAAAARAGVWRFAADSSAELAKIARCAPGSAVHVRLAVDDSRSAFPLSAKFGVGAGRAVELLEEAGRLGLQPHGLTFHVGSQCRDLLTWSMAVASAGEVLETLRRRGTVPEMLDLGGGFPAWYGEEVPSVEQVGAVVLRAVDDLPHRPAIVVAEPGRHLAAETAVMVAGVIGREERGGQQWLHLDVGAYHGLIETQQGAAGWRYPLWTSRPGHAEEPLAPFTVTGPTCDSGDTLFTGVELPAGTTEGDRVYLASAGAYTLAYASSFNGFPPPRAVFAAG